MSTEKEYVFTRSTGLDKDGKWNEETYRLKESELEQKHKDLLLGNLIEQVNNAPKDVLLEFTHQLYSLMLKQKADKLWNKFVKNLQ